MTQMESLFETDDQGAWRIEMRFKIGGGPFDPSGFSVMVTNPAGNLHDMMVHKAGSTDQPMAELVTFHEIAWARLMEMLSAEVMDELRRTALRGRTVNRIRTDPPTPKNPVRRIYGG